MNKHVITHRFLTLCCTFLLLFSGVSAQEYTLTSPNGKLKADIMVSANLVYRIYHGSKLLVYGKPIGMTIGKKNRLGENEFNPKEERDTVNRKVSPVVAARNSTITEAFEELTLQFKSGLSVQFRCYDRGFAYRTMTESDVPEIEIKEEHMGFELTTDPDVWWPKESSFFSHNERAYPKKRSLELKKGEKASLPILWHWENGPFLLYTETDLRDYPGMYLKTDGAGGYEAIHPKHPATTAKFFDRWEMVGFTKTYIAKTEGTRSYPWRIFTLAESEADLLHSELPWLLSKPTELTDTDWIQPGKVQWDWWHALRLKGVDFKPGLNTRTYKYYIDFAAANDIPYIIMDEGWYKLGNLLKVKKNIDMQNLLSYAKEKGVGIILWTTWKTLDKQFEEAFEQFANWGIAGIKVDFMQRRDQPMVNFYERVAKKAAENRMLVDFHGSHAPKGLQRTYPNVLTYEGVRGLEWNKWSGALTVDHDVTIPFTRMLAGPMDYTPGAMRNISNPKKHRMSYRNPKSQGTRCHELAKYVVYESPLQMLADAPTAYEAEPECLAFLKEVPTTWDETVVLDATVGEHIVLARRKGNTWFVGGMTGSLGQTLSIDLSFLKSGVHSMEIWRDGDSTPTDGTSYVKLSEPSITPDMKYVISMAEGGGWVAIIRKK